MNEKVPLSAVFLTCILGISLGIVFITNNKRLDNFSKPLLLFWSGRRGSNSRHQAWEACVPPLNYSRCQYAINISFPAVESKIYSSGCRPLCLGHPPPFPTRERPVYKHVGQTAVSESQALMLSNCASTAPGVPGSIHPISGWARNQVS